MDKSPDAFRTISRGRRRPRLPQHVLRFWETRFSQIRPLKRGGGRRYYRPDDVDLLKGIRHLLYGEGYTIKGVQRILKAEGIRFVQGVGRGEETVVAPFPGEDADGTAEPEMAPVATVTISRGRHAGPGSRRNSPSALDDLRECDRLLSNLQGSETPDE